MAKPFCFGQKTEGKTHKKGKNAGAQGAFLRRCRLRPADAVVLFQIRRAWPLSAKKEKKKRVGACKAGRAKERVAKWVMKTKKSPEDQLIFGAFAGAAHRA